MKGYEAASYGDGFASVYDDWYDGLPDRDAAVSLLAGLAGVAPMLELGIGTGRLALALARRGIDVQGVDASQAMIDELRRKDGGDTIPVTVADLGGEDPAGPFSVIFVASNTFFALPTAEAQQRCFANVARRLAPGGCFVVEAFVPDDSIEAGSAVRVRDLAVDRVVLTVTVDDPSAQSTVGQFVELTEAGGVRLHPFSIRYATPAQLDAMAAAAGLRLVSRFADWRGAEFHADSTAHVSVWRPITD